MRAAATYQTSHRSRGAHGTTNGLAVHQKWRTHSPSGRRLFITSDQNIKYQQNLAERRIAILVLSTNHWGVIHRNVMLIAAAVRQIQAGEFVELELLFSQ